MQSQKIVDKVRETSGAGQNKFHPETIANVLNLSEMTKKKIVTFDTGYKSALGCILVIKLLSFQPIMTGFISVNCIRSF